MAKNDEPVTRALEIPPWDKPQEGASLGPGARWIGSPNFGYPKGAHGRQGHQVVAIVMHIAQGTLAGCDAYFQEQAPGGNADNAVSSHFCIGMRGEIHQYVDVEDAAWGNGVVEDTAQLPADAPTGVNPNLWTVSIEHEGHTGQKFYLAQIEATLSVASWLVSYWGLRPSFETIIPHSRIAPSSRRYCPGTTFPLGGIIDVLRAERGMVPLLRTGKEG